MENAKIARCAYNFISRIGGIKDVLLLFQACSCLVVLVVSPSHVITCRHKSFQDVLLSKHDLNMQQDDFKFSKEMNENLCTYKHSDTFFNRFLFLVIGFTVVGFIQIKGRITTRFLTDRISTVHLLNIVLTAYALIGLSKYFIFPQLNSILYGYSSIFQLLLSPMKLILTCVLVIVGFPLSLFYRYSRTHLFEIPKSAFVDLVFSADSDSYRSAFEAVPDEMLSINCGNVCWSVFKWSNLFLLTLHIIACALLINKESTNDTQSSSKASCKTCLHSKSLDKLSFLPYHDEANKNDLRNKFATKPVNVTKPLNVSPTTLRKKKMKVEASTQTTEAKDDKMSRRSSSVKRRILQLEGSMCVNSSTMATQTSTALPVMSATTATQTNVVLPVMSATIATQTNVVLPVMSATIATQTNVVLPVMSATIATQTNVVLPVMSATIATQTKVVLPVMSATISTQTIVKLSTKSNQTIGDTLEVFNSNKLSQTSDSKPERITSDKVSQTVTNPNPKPINKLSQTDSIPKPKSANKSIQLSQSDLKLYKTCATSTNQISCNDFSTQTDIIKNDNDTGLKDKIVCDNELLVKDSEIVDNENEPKQNEIDNVGIIKIEKTFNEMSIQTKDKTFVTIATSIDTKQSEKHVQTTIENSDKYVQKNTIMKEVNDKAIQATEPISSQPKAVQNSLISHEDMCMQTDDVFILSIAEGEEYIRSASSELVSLNVSEESLTTETYELTVSLDDLEESISVLCIDSVSEMNEEEISVRSLESGFVDESDDSYNLEEPQKLFSDENEDCFIVKESSKVTVEERICQTISVAPLTQSLPRIIPSLPTTMDQCIQISSKCHCNKNINRMNKRTQTSVNSLEKSVQVYSLRSDKKERSDSRPLATFDDEIIYSSRDSLYFDCEDRDSNSLRRKSLTSTGTNTEYSSSFSDQSIQTNEKREVTVSHSNMNYEYLHVTEVGEKELKELEYREIENICKIWDNKKSYTQQLNKSTQIDFLEVRESLNDLNSCSCKKENIGKTVYSMMTLDEQMYDMCEPIKFKAKKSCHGVWYACLRGDVFLTVSQEVLTNIHLLSEIENIERFVDDNILDTMKAFIANYSRLSVYFDDDLAESDDESFINGFRL